MMARETHQDNLRERLGIKTTKKGSLKSKGLRLKPQKVTQKGLRVRGWNHQKGLPKRVPE